MLSVRCSPHTCSAENVPVSVIASPGISFEHTPFSRAPSKFLKDEWIQDVARTINAIQMKYSKICRPTVGGTD